MIWLTADVHHAACDYDPHKAVFSGLIRFNSSAGRFMLTSVIHRSTPSVRNGFVSIPKIAKANRLPRDGLQFFARCALTADEELTVSQERRG